jgi:NADH-quinone oxidoreductase subunit D
MTVAISSLLNKIRVPDSDSGPIDAKEYFINMGPQHPATHGVLRLMLKLDGETIREVIPVPGYIHRGIEKIGESVNYRQFVHLTDRMDYLSAMMNNWVVSMGVERATNTVMNDRIEYIRTIFAELERIQSHMLWWGVLGMDLGAFTPFLYGFRDREQITDIFEETVGCRLTMNYIQPGGLMADIHPNFVKRVKEAMAYSKPKIDEYEELLSGNVILQERTKNIGILPAADAISLGVTGPPLRASGVPYDLRKAEPYGAYGKVEFRTAIGTIGDCWDRYWVRVEEMRQSIHIVEQLIDNIPEGKFMLMKPAKKLVIPEGIYYNALETARGILGMVIASDGKSEKPVRIHMRSPNYNNLWAVDTMTRGSRIGDLVANISSLDFVVPDIDR